MKSFELPNKIIWRRDNSQSLSETFYLSFYKDIQKRLGFFHDHFDFQFVKANQENMKKYFLPLYEKEIMIRADYLLNRETIVQEFLEKVAKSDAYRFLFIFHEGKVILATLFSLHDNGLFIGYRAVKRNVDNRLRHDATVAYWGEKLLFDYGNEQGVSFVSRGKDTHPFLGKSNIGRPLYKLKTGVKPKAPVMDKTLRFLQVTEKDIMASGEPVLFFDAPNSEGFYQKSLLYYPEGLLAESYIKEFQKVFDWVGVSFTPVPY